MKFKKRYVFIFLFFLGVCSPIFFRHEIFYKVLQYLSIQKFPGAGVEIELAEIDFFPGPVQIKIKNYKLIKEAKTVFSVGDLNFTASGISVSPIAGHFNVQLDGLELDLKTFQGLVKDVSEDKKGQAEGEHELDPFQSLKKIERVTADISLNQVLIQDIQKKYQAKILLKEISAKGISFQKPFDISLKLNAEFKDKINKAEVSLKSKTDLNLVDFVSKGVASLTTQNTIQTEINDFKVPELNLKAQGQLGMKSSKGVQVSLDSAWANFKSTIDADLVSEDFKLNQFQLSVHPSAVLNHLKTKKGLDLAINDDLELFCEGSAGLLKGNATADLKLGTKKAQHFQLGEKKVSLSDVLGEIKVKQEAQKIQANGKVGYGKSKIDYSTELQDNKPLGAKISALLKLEDAEPFMPLLTSDFKLLQSEHAIEFEGSVKFEGENIIPNLTLKNTGEISVVNSEEQKITVKSLAFTASGNQNAVKFETSMDGQLQVPKQPELSFSTKGLGEANKDKQVKANFELTTWAQNKQDKSGSTQAKLDVTLSPESLNLNSLNGELFFKDFAPFIPKDMRRKLVDIERSKASIAFNGQLQYAKEKISGASFEANLKDKIVMRDEGNQMVLNSLQARLDPLSTKDSLPISLGLAGYLQKNGRSDKVSLSSTNKLVIDLKQTLEAKKPHAQLDLNAKVNQYSTAKALVKISGEKIAVDNLQVLNDLRDFSAMIPEQSRKLIQNFQSAPQTIKIAGNIEFHKKTLDKLDISLKNERPFNLILPEGIVGALNIDLKATRQSIDFSSNLSLLDGKIFFGAKSQGVKKMSDLTFKSLFPRQLTAQISDIKIKKDLARKVLYSSVPSIGQPMQAPRAQPPANFKFFKDFPPFTMTLGKSFFFLDQARFDASGDFHSSEGAITSENLLLKAGEGTAGLKVKTTLIDNQAKATIKGQIKNLNLISFAGFLPPIVETVSGGMNGDFLGVVYYGPPKETEYKADYDFSFTNGEIKKINLTQQIRAIVSKFSLLKDHADKVNVILDDKFDHLKIKGKVSNKVLILDNFSFVGIKNSLGLEGKGYLGQPASKQSSELTFKMRDLTGKVTPTLKNFAGREDIPIKLTGMEIDLKPDYQYSLKEVGGSAVQAQVDKQVDKVKDELSKNLQKQATEMLGNLFGGKKKKK
jgi:hypothetical protein